MNTIIAERAAAKYMRDFDTADTLRDELRGDFKVFVDDKALEWRRITRDRGGRGWE